MSYRPNQSQQLSIFDRSLRLTERERKCLEKSWAKVFSDEIFASVDKGIHNKTIKYGLPTY